jgi:hypothetical protein
MYGGGMSCDLAKAFDHENHEMLLSEPIVYGI